MGYDENKFNLSLISKAILREDLEGKSSFNLKEIQQGLFKALKDSKFTDMVCVICDQLGKEVVNTDGEFDVVLKRTIGTNEFIVSNFHESHLTVSFNGHEVMCIPFDIRNARIEKKFIPGIWVKILALLHDEALDLEKEEARQEEERECNLYYERLILPDMDLYKEKMTPEIEIGNEESQEEWMVENAIQDTYKFLKYEASTYLERVLEGKLSDGNSDHNNLQRSSDALQLWITYLSVQNDKSLKALILLYFEVVDDMLQLPFAASRDGMISVLGHLGSIIRKKIELDEKGVNLAEGKD